MHLILFYLYLFLFDMSGNCFLTGGGAQIQALDTQLLVVASDLIKEQVSQLFVEGTAFDTSRFATHLVSLMTNLCVSCAHCSHITKLVDVYLINVPLSDS